MFPAKLPERFTCPIALSSSAARAAGAWYRRQKYSPTLICQSGGTADAAGNCWLSCIARLRRRRAIQIRGVTARTLGCGRFSALAQQNPPAGRNTPSRGLSNQPMRQPSSRDQTLALSVAHSLVKSDLRPADVRLALTYAKPAPATDQLSAVSPVRRVSGRHSFDDPKRQASLT
jgi:hypothetical protein